MARLMGKPTPAQLRALARRDPRLGEALLRVPAYPGYPDRGERSRKTHFAALARSIVYQQVAGAAARAILSRVVALTPGREIPRPEELLELGHDALRGAGLSRQKIASLTDLAERVCDGRLVLHCIGTRSDEEIVERLTSVRGIGEWTAQMFLMFRLGRLDVMPAGDLAVQEGLRILDGSAERPRPREVLARTESWSPLRSVGAWVCWRLTDAKE